mmetsp:Transcript_26458/g.41005  ORF Transcript_26458/g.41005 Transcript_26458/m.41005 type:complete len:215 (+) Transcript_26458:195-839(+)
MKSNFLFRVVFPLVMGTTSAFVVNNRPQSLVRLQAQERMSLPEFDSKNLFDMGSIDSSVPSEAFKGAMKNMQTTYRIFQDALSAGYDLKLCIACAIAGEYNVEEVRAQISDHIASHPCVLFTWEQSPSCQKAIKYLDVAGADYKIVYLDKPWSEGNKMRAELAKTVGKSSVPIIFIDGDYVGGYDSGVGKDSPGLVDMAFQGTLRSKLEIAGAL